MKTLGWMTGRVVRDSRGHFWLVKWMRYFPGYGIRVGLTRPRANHFTTLTEAARQYVVVGALP